MVSAQHKVMLSTASTVDVGTKEELSRSQALGSASLLLVTSGSYKNCCIYCEQLDHLLGLVAGLKEVVEKLRSRREAEPGGDGYWPP